MMGTLKYSFALLCLLGMLNCHPQADLPIEIPLPSHWEFKQVNDSIWYPATVPGTVHTDLLHNNLIEDPFAKDNETKLQWISDTDWEYRTAFKVHPGQLRKKHLELTFDGLDTYASVFLNDSLILKSDNAFRYHHRDVKSLLKRNNTLRILFEHPSQYESDAAAQLPHQLPEGHRIFTRKPQFQYGWDWGPKFNTCGIWRRISLMAWDDLKIRDLYVRQIFLDDEKADLELRLTQSSILQSLFTYKVFINDKPYGSFEKIPENGQVKLPVEILNPNRWWPHNIGTPYLYTVKVAVFQDKKLLDQIEVKTGIRTVELVTEDEGDGESFYFVVNGVPVYSKGANYIPQNSFQTEVTDSHYNRLLSDAVEANMNMLRVWGGGLYENDVFYDLADEKGLMIWQDFMFACAMYPGDSAFLENVEQEAIQNVKRLRNHPSVVLWCGNNEVSEGWHRWGWQDGRTSEEKKSIWSDYLLLFDTLLPTIVRNFSTTPYWESSPLFGRGDPEYLNRGDAHDWWVWHDGCPFEHFEENVPKFMSEFGFQSFPDLRTARYITQSSTLDFTSERFRNHQKHSLGFELIDDYMRRDFPVPSTPEQYLYVSQLVQAHGIVKGIEAQRRSRPHCMGSLYWQLNDCWPAVSWSSIDYFGHWKALHYKARDAFANLLVSAQLSADTVTIFLVNDLLTDQTGDLTGSVCDFHGNVLLDFSQTVSVHALSSERVCDIDLASLEFDPHSSVLKLTFGGQTQLFYFVRPRDLRLIDSEITSRISREDGGFSIELRSEVLQKNAFIQTETDGHFTDNFFDIMPNEPTTVFFRTASATLDDVTIMTLNKVIRSSLYQENESRMKE